MNVGYHPGKMKKPHYWCDTHFFEEREPTLAKLASVLDSLYHDTSRAILAGENQHISFRKGGSFVLATPKIEAEEADPLLGIFPESRYISLLEVLSTVNRATRFLDEFRHWHITKITSTCCIRRATARSSR